MIVRKDNAVADARFSSALETLRVLRAAPIPRTYISAFMNKGSSKSQQRQEEEEEEESSDAYVQPQHHPLSLCKPCEPKPRDFFIPETAFPQLYITRLPQDWRCCLQRICPSAA